MDKKYVRWALWCAFFAGSWAAFFGFAWWICGFALCERAQMWSWAGDADPQGLWGVGGLARAAGLWMGSVMATPAAGAAVLASLLAVASLSMLLIMRRIGRGAAWTAPLALCPGVALSLMLCDVYAPVSTTVAVTAALVGAGVCMLMRKWWMSAACALILGAGIAYSCGPWLLPGASYVPWISTPGSGAALLIGLALPLVAAVAARFMHLRKNKVRIVWSAIACVVLLIFSFKQTASMRRPIDEALCELSYYAWRGQWGKIESRCKTLPMADEPLLQNYWSLAMAEQGRLGESLFAQPWAQPRSIIDLSQRSPMAYMLFSDIAWSMGQVGLAQRYAFEANEALGNSSPRMLKRLAETNLAYGQEAVAQKYSRLLGQPVTMNSEIEAKRKCIPAADAFSMDPALEPDLLATLRANPAHTTTMQYLGCMRLLSKDIPHFAELILEFCGTPALPSPLPQHFQEAVAMAALADEANSDLASQCGIDYSLMQACQAFWSHQQQLDESYWHYIRDYKPANQ